MHKVIIFSAPSGAGKTTVVRHLLGARDDLAFSVSATTRSKRTGEVDGRDYFFLDTEEFKRRIEHGDFVEYEEVYKGLFYGTLKSEVERIWGEGKAVLFDVDVIGGLNLKKIFGNAALSVFVKPPSLEVLEQRLRARGTETEEKVMERVAKAAREMEYENAFDVVLLNDRLEDTKSKAGELAAEFLGI